MKNKFKKLGFIFLFNRTGAMFFILILFLTTCKKKDSCETCRNNTTKGECESDGCVWDENIVSQPGPAGTNTWYLHSEGKCYCEAAMAPPVEKSKKNVSAWTFYSKQDVVKGLITDQNNKLWASVKDPYNKTEVFDGGSWISANIVYNIIGGNKTHAKSMSVSSKNIVWAASPFHGLANIDASNLGSYPKWDVDQVAYSQIPSDKLSSVIVESDTVIWVGSDKGLIKYNSQKFKYTNYNTTNSTLISNIVMAIGIDKNKNKWMGTSEGLTMFDGQSFLNIDLNSEISSIVVDTLGAIWGGSSNGLYRYKDSKVDYFDDSNSGLDRNTINTLAVGKDGKVWIGTDHGIYAYEGGKIVEYIPSNQSDIGYDVYSITSDKNGKIWIGTSKGVATF